MLTLFAWMVPLLIAAEFGYVAYRRRNRYPRFLFNVWAPTLYTAMILGDLLLALVLTALLGGPTPETANQVSTLTAWSVVVGLAALGIGLLTLFFRWVAHTEITDPPP
ncbi:MAG TPA: hypothetical protein VM536_03475 [Chloroflexia bacterium]|nr:hypothetical protein [Chloroflexia bacterium]